MLRFHSACILGPWSRDLPGHTFPESCPTASLSSARYKAFADLWRGRFCVTHHASAWLRKCDARRATRLSTSQSSVHAECCCPAHFLSQKVWGRQSAAAWPTLAASDTADRAQAGIAHVPLPAFDGSAISHWSTPQSGGHRLATVSDVGGLHRHSYRRCTAPPLAITHFGLGFTHMEQSASERRLVDVTDCFQAASQIRAFLAMVWPGLCLTILLHFTHSLYDAWLWTRPFYCKVFLQS